ncbi:MAG: ABC transporter substrate-binding protein [Clostridiales bacterium]|jgi:ABC-type Fe3+ transport system substrate-binding protein|nr:ABC transporter substrate-binding protein [Clostridiales bacterium]
MLYDYKNINFMALLPCPLRVAFEKTAMTRSRQFEKQYGETVKCVTVSGMDNNIMAELASITDINEWPEVIMLPGYGLPFSESFKRRFRDTGCFESIMEEDNPLYLESGIYDPKHYYDVIGVGVIVFVVDKTYNEELETPKSWYELTTDECYAQTVGMVGHEWAGFQDSPVINAYKLGGEDMVRGLAKSAKCCLLAAEMVRMAGSKRGIAPEVIILSYNMARAAIKNDKTQLVWPEEGAGSVPLVLLTKKSASEKARQLAKYLICEETASVLNMGGFYASADTKPYGEGQLMWPGWEFLETTDMPKLSMKLNKIMMENANIIRTRKAPQECAL